ncbi:MULTISPECIES: hypothetical protein [unclassified Bradyrhizobium]|uniref:hypothetical protein n=1 Tax=unclassified Bradyrhizobium TaxID=2631580 RepID=UPI002478B2BE|nr:MULTISPECIES: hypothetical protein [unclassified Bradyrhizobium]WGS18953.1 hypothetical protein MTX22_31245 [Bradyrhizobium sp. ISRA463]WGS25786.1 hypothetical protein MTX19_28815 [Bradyrhizobium sp. ISRA464]
MTQLAQAYIHLKPYSASHKQIRSLGRYAKRVAIRAAADIYGGEVEIEVQIEEGSLITRVTVAGSIFLGVYGFVANYKGFKEGVVEMCNDAREFAVDVCKPFIKKAGVPKEDVYRFERRLKVPGKLYRLDKRLEQLEKSVGELSPHDMQRELGRLRSELESITEHLSPEERQLLSPTLKRTKLPPPENWPAPEEPKAALRKEDDLEQSLLFSDEPQIVPEDYKPKLVFREVAKVPRRKNGRRGKRRQLERSDLLS